MAERLIENLPHLIAILILMGLSGMISASETALFALTRKHLAELNASGRFGASTVIQLREQPQGLLSTILLSNTAVNILLYSMLGVTTVRLAQGSPLWSAVLGVGGFVVAVFCAEIIPKQVALALAAGLAPVVAVPLKGLLVATKPIRWLLENLFVEPLTRLLTGTSGRSTAVTPEELQELVRICQNEGLIDDRENVIIHHVVELSDMRVSALMVPRVDFVAFSLSDGRARLAEQFKSSRLLHIPVYEGGIDNVVGVIHARDFFLHPERPLRELVRPVHFIPEQAQVEALLAHFRRTGTKLAIVVDEYGGLAGVVAMEDVVECIVGDLAVPDEPLEGPPVVRISDTVFLVDAGLNVDGFRRAFELPLEDTRIDTVGGLLAEQLGRLPAHGDEVRIGHAVIRVVSIRKRRVIRVKVILDDAIEENADLSLLLGAARPARGEELTERAETGHPAEKTE